VHNFKLRDFEVLQMRWKINFLGRKKISHNNLTIIYFIEESKEKETNPLLWELQSSLLLYQHNITKTEQVLKFT